MTLILMDKQALMELFEGLGRFIQSHFWLDESEIFIKDACSYYLCENINFFSIKYQDQKLWGLKV